MVLLYLREMRSHIGRGFAPKYNHNWYTGMYWGDGNQNVRRDYQRSWKCRHKNKSVGLGEEVFIECLSDGSLTVMSFETTGPDIFKIR